MTPLLEATVAVPPRLGEMRLRLEPGERVALIGPNGSGKTTLLRALAGIAHLPKGCAVEVLGEDLHTASATRRSRLLGYLPASREMRWPIPVRDVVGLGLTQPDNERVTKLLDRLHLTIFAERPIDSLSTGERARALLARALANHPRLLLLDEPLSNLDPAWILRTLALLDEVATEDGAAIVVALHDLSLLGRFERVWMLDGGRLVADLPPGALLASPDFGQVFGVEPAGTGWALRPGVDRRSSP